MPLTLTRNPGESVVLDTTDGPVTITVDRTPHGRVCLRIDAPDCVRIWRSELLTPEAAARRKPIALRKGGQ